MTTKTDGVKWFVWLHGAAMVPMPQIIMGDATAPYKNEYTKTHFIKAIRIEFEHIELDLTTLLSNPIYQLTGAPNDSVANAKDSKGAASAP